MTRLYIIGGGGFGAEVAMICDVLLESGSQPFTSYAFLDDAPGYLQERGMGELVAGPATGHDVQEDALYVCAIGDPSTRHYLAGQYEKSGARFHTLIHPHSQVSPRATIGDGTIVAFGGGVYPFVKLGRHTHINANSGIGHDATLGECCTLSAQVDITGFAEIGDQVFFGSGARVLPKVRVDSFCRIGAGVVVIRNLKPKTTLFLNPPNMFRKD